MPFDGFEEKAKEKLRLSLEIERLITKLVERLGSEDVKDKIRRYIRNKYVEGLEKQEDVFDMNFVKNQDDLDFLLKYVDGVVGNTTERINQDLRGIMERAILDDASLESVKMRIKEEFNSIQYLNRFKMVVRTEGLRAENQGSLDAAKQLSFKVKKYVDIVRDDRTSDICIKEHEKYGSKEKAIDLDEDFVIEHNNKTVVSQAPPFHPNCRTVIRFVEVEE